PRRGTNCLLGQVILVIARLGALGGTAALAFVRTARADASIAGALLAEQFASAPSNLAAAQRGVRAGALIGQVHQHNVVKQLLVDLAAELRRVDVDRAHLVALAVVHVERDHDVLLPRKKTTCASLHPLSSWPSPPTRGSGEKERRSKDHFIQCRG